MRPSTSSSQSMVSSRSHIEECWSPPTPDDTHAEPQVWRRQPRNRPVMPLTMGQPVTRKVDSSGGISLAGVNYRVGNAHRKELGRSSGGRRHRRDLTERETVACPRRETRPGQSPRCLRQPRRQTRPDQRRKPNPRSECRGGTGARLLSGYRDSTRDRGSVYRYSNAPSNSGSVTVNPRSGLVAKKANRARAAPARARSFRNWVCSICS